MEKLKSKYGFPEKDFELFFRQYYRLALLISVKLTRDLISSEDIVQDAFLNIWRNSDLNLSDPGLKSYLLKSVKNRSLNFIRDKKEHLEFVPDLHESVDEEYSFERDEKMAKMLFEIDNLPPKCKEIFEMILFKKLKYKEVAKILNISTNTVKTQLSVAYKQLKKAYLFFF